MDDEQPLLATATVTKHSSKTIEFVIFTKTRVLYFKGRCEADQPPSIRIIPRRTLKDLTVINSPAVIAGGRYLDGEAHFQLAYSNGVEFDLNARDATQGSIAEMAQLLPALYADLDG